MPRDGTAPGLDFGVTYLTTYKTAQKEQVV